MATSIKSLAGTREGVNKSGVGRTALDANKTGVGRSAVGDVNKVGANAGPGTSTIARGQRGSYVKKAAPGANVSTSKLVSS